MPETVPALSSEEQVQADGKMAEMRKEFQDHHGVLSNYPVVSHKLTPVIVLVLLEAFIVVEVINLLFASTKVMRFFGEIVGDTCFLRRHCDGPG